MRRIAVLLAFAVVLPAVPAAAQVTGPNTKRCATAKKAAAKKKTKKARKAARRACTRPRRPAPAPVPVAPAVPVESPAEPTSEPVTVDPPADEEEPVAPTVPAEPLGRSLGITQHDEPVFFLSLSRSVVASGPVTIQVNNRGEDPHDLRLETLGGLLVDSWDELLSHTASVPRSVTLSAGTYRVFCTLPGHATAGMDTQFSVLDS